MSIRNLYTDGLKDYQDLNIDSIIARQVDAISSIILGLNVQNINVEDPFLEIFVNDDTHFTNDVVIDGALTVTGDIINPDIEVNTISTYDTSKIELISDTILYQSDFKQTSIVGQDSITAPDAFHLQSDGKITIFLQSDRDNITEEDTPTIWASQDGQNAGFSIGMSADNRFELISGGATQTSGNLEIYSKQFTGNGDDIPSWTGGARIARFDGVTGILFDNDLDMQLNDILNVGVITVDEMNGDTDPLSMQMLSQNVGFGTADSFGRAQFHWSRTNDPDPDNGGGTYAGMGGVIRMGDLSANGDSFDQISEGFVCYGQNDSGVMDAANYGFSRIKPLRFQLLEAIAGVQKDIFRADPTELSYSPTGIATDVLNINNTRMLVDLDTDCNSNNILNVNAIEVDQISDSVGAGGVFMSADLIVSGGVNLTVAGAASELILSGLASDLSTDILVLDSSNTIKTRSQPFGSSIAYAESLTSSTSADTVNWVTKVTITQAFAAGDYVVEVHALVGNDTADNITDIQLLEDSVAVNTSDIAAPNINVGSAKIPMSMSWRRTLTAASHQFDLEFRPRANVGEIEDARIVIYRFA